MTLYLLAEDLTLALGYLRPSQVRLVASVSPAARARALSYHHTVDPKDNASLAVWGLSSLSTHVVIHGMEDVRTLGPVVGQVHTITFGADTSLETYKAAFKRFPRATKLVNVKLDHKSAPHVARMSSVEVLECQPRADLTPAILKLVAPLTNLQRIKLGDEEPSFDMMVRLVDQFQHYDALRVSTLRNPVIESEAGCDAFVRLAYRTLTSGCTGGSTSNMTIAEVCRVLRLTLESKAKIVYSCIVADLLIQLLQQALARLSASSAVARVTNGRNEAYDNNAEELSSEESDLITVGNVSARFAQDTDAALVKSTFETVQVHSILITWLTVATTSEVFNPLLMLCRTLLQKYEDLARFFETPSTHATIMNVFLRVGVPSQLVSNASRTLFCILPACEGLRSLFETPTTRKSLTLASIQNRHDLRTVHALRSVMTNLAGSCKLFRPASNPYTTVSDAFVAVMMSILTPATVEEVCRETGKMIGLVTHQTDNEEELSVHHSAWEAAEANLVSMSVDDWLTRLMATSSVALQGILRQKFLLKC